MTGTNGKLPKGVYTIGILLTWQWPLRWGKVNFSILFINTSIYLLLLWWCPSGGLYQLWYTIPTYKMHDWMGNVQRHKDTQITFKVSTSFVSFCVDRQIVQVDNERAQLNLGLFRQKKTYLHDNCAEQLAKSFNCRSQQSHYEWMEIWQSAINNKQQIALQSIEDRDTDRKEDGKRPR